MKRAKNTQ